MSIREKCREKRPIGTINHSGATVNVRGKLASEVIYRGNSWVKSVLQKMQEDDKFKPQQTKHVKVASKTGPRIKNSNWKYSDYKNISM